ncbi:DUF4397 domain-containing protein [Ferrimonas senticii]|uniref:DUF4397 domain-containing protein n=1 Tax=Ferrimonas senticii TaxID=394566 RepID=UPI0003FE7710|nr:DUF4397 domain-containing protein [Ferrimonas senticii]
MPNLTKYSAAVLSTLMVVGCGSSSDDHNPAAAGGGAAPVTPTTEIRVLHASSDAPKVNIGVNGANALEGVDYLTGSAFIELDSASYSINVDAILPDGSTTTVIGPADFNLEADTEYSVIAVGNVADGTLEPLVLARADEDFGAGNIRLQVLHAASQAPTVDIYVTAPGADLTTSEPTLSGVPFKANSDLLEVAAGEYQIRITAEGSKDAVFDTGTLTLEAGTDLLLAAVNNTLTGSSPVAVVAWSDEGTVTITDVNAGSELRVVHASPDAPEVNVLANGNAILTNVPYPVASGYLNVPAGDYNVQVEPAAAPGTFVIDADVTLDINTAYTVLAINELAEIAPWVVTDDRRRIATEAGLRLLHASPSAGNVDIYVGSDNDISDETPAFSDVPIMAETGRVPLAAGTYFVTVTPTGSQDAAIGPLELTLEAGKLYTAIARDQAGGGTPLGVILLDDLVAD